MESDGIGDVGRFRDRTGPKRAKFESPIGASQRWKKASRKDENKREVQRISANPP